MFLFHQGVEGLPQGCGGVSVDTEASADTISADSDFVLVVTTDETGTCAGASGGGDGVGCAASACRNASQACSTSHTACTVIAAQCTDEPSCLIAQAACQASISVSASPFAVPTRHVCRHPDAADGAAAWCTDRETGAEDK
jgi:hypothetical protein